MGTPEFASVSLEQLYGDGHDIAAVITQPDKPRNRGMKVSFNPVKELALAHGTPVYQPAGLRDGESAEILRGLECELIAVVAYGKLLPDVILELPPLGCINIHGSLLPKYRGAAPVQWAVLNGEAETGVTSMFMSAQLDAGDILLSEKTTIGVDETAGELYDRLSIMGAGILSETVEELKQGTAVRTAQNHSDATFAPPLKKDMSPIDWTQSAFCIKCKVRGLNPWPVATTEIGGTTYKIFAVDITDREYSGKPGDVVSTGQSGIEIGCADGTVLIKELQAPGGKRMAAADYLRGARGIAW